MIKKSPAHQSKTKCRACPAKGKAGDSRCTLMSDKNVVQDSSSSKENCPPCGCQKCPDNKMYANSVTNYCNASESTSCKPASAKFHCLIACPSDSRCQTLDYDKSQVACGCACQKCPDGNYYKGTTDYTSPNTKALTSEQQGECPNVVHPIQEPKDMCS